MRKPIPESLKDHILPFNWDVRKVWALKAEVQQLPCAKFAYFLELPLWSSVGNRGLLFDISQMDVIRHPGLSRYQVQRLDQCSLDFPIDVLVMHDKPWILDGVHRIAKHAILTHLTLPVRLHDESIIPAIRVV
ncbi:MAG: hypothetical protein ABIG35_09220 [Pseudomonadota bacterium]